MKADSATVEAQAADEADGIGARIAERLAELNGKRRLTKAEREELAILTYDGPAPRRIAPSDEVPF